MLTLLDLGMNEICERGARAIRRAFLKSKLTTLNIERSELHTESSYMSHRIASLTCTDTQMKIDRILK